MSEFELLIANCQLPIHGPYPYIKLKTLCLTEINSCLLPELKTATLRFSFPTDRPSGLMKWKNAATIKTGSGILSWCVAWGFHFCVMVHPIIKRIQGRDNMT